MEREMLVCPTRGPKRLTRDGVSHSEPNSLYEPLHTLAPPNIAPIFTQARYEFPWLKHPRQEERAVTYVPPSQVILAGLA